MGADAGEEAGLTLGGDGEAVVGDELDERVGNVGQGLGGGSSVSAWHVSDAVVEDAFFDVDGVVVGSGPRGFGATSLIDGDIDEDASWSHAAKHGAGDKLGGFSSGNEDGSNEEIDVGEKFVEMGLIRKEGVGGVHSNIKKAHAFEVDFENGDIGAEASGHTGGVDAGGTAADDDDATWEYTRDAPEKNSASPGVFGKEVGADDDRHTAGDF